LWGADARASLIVPLVVRWAPLGQALAVALIDVSVEVETDWAWLLSALAFTVRGVEELTAWASIVVEVTDLAVLVVEVLVVIKSNVRGSADAFVSLSIVVGRERVTISVCDSRGRAVKWLWEARAGTLIPVSSINVASLWGALAHAVGSIPLESIGASLWEADALGAVWVEVVSILAHLGEWEASAVGQVPSLVRSARLSNALAVARVLVPEASLITGWSAVGFRAVLVFASASASVLIPLFAFSTWVNSWFNALAGTVVLRPVFVGCAVNWRADASAVSLRPMGGGSAHDWAADTSVNVVRPDLHVVASFWNHEALAAGTIPVLAGCALFWLADASAIISGEDEAVTACSTLDALASASLGVEVFAAYTILRRALAFTVHLIPVVSIGAGVVLLSELALARGEVPDESWLASGWSAFAFAIFNVEVLGLVVDIRAVQWEALASALVLVPLTVETVWLCCFRNKAAIWLSLALALAGLSVPNEIGDGWVVDGICVGRAVFGWDANASALVVVPDKVSAAGVSSSWGKADTSLLLWSPCVTIEAVLWFQLAMASVDVKVVAVVASWSVDAVRCEFKRGGRTWLDIRSLSLSLSEIRSCIYFLKL